MNPIKRYLTSILIILTMLPCVAQKTDTDSIGSRKKVAVVLSGGGAFGAIHIGFLKVLEEAGLPVDIVVGTSMGSIVGALYSVGYNSDDIAKMFLSMDWAELFLDNSDYQRLTLNERDAQNTYFYERDFYTHGVVDPHPGGVIRGTRVESAFRRYLHGYTDSIDFLSDMPRRFACVATDLVSDDEVVFTRGSLVKSIRSSMSIPGVFTPVRMNGKVLVDGGAKNNFAADVARKLGADIVIGAKFDLELDSNKQYRTLLDIMERSAGSDVSRRAKENEKYCDLVIKVPVRGFTSGSFTDKAIKTLIERGETATREKLDSIRMLKAESGADPARDYSLHLRDIESIPKPGNEPSGLINNHETNVLLASLGLRFDTEQIAAMQVNGRYFLGDNLNKELNLTLRLGSHSMIRMGFDLEPWKFKKMGLSYEFGYRYFDIFTHGKRSDNLSFIYQNAKIKLFSIEAMNFDAEVGLGWRHFHHFQRLWNEYSTTTFDTNEYYFNYYARLRFDNEDNKYFTRNGTRAEVSYEYCTDNFAGWNGGDGFSALTARLQTTIPLTGSTHLRPAVNARLLFGESFPTMSRNVAGGTFYGKYLSQQLPFPGVRQIEFFDSKFLSGSLRLQQQISGRHYLLAEGCVAEHNESLRDIFKRKPLWGAQVGYSYNSIAGPIGITFGWSTHTHRLSVLLSAGFDF